MDGTTASFSVYVTGGPEPIMQWERRAAGSTEWQVIPESGWERASSGLQIAATIGLDGEQFRCIATNSLGTATSRVATLRVRRTQPLLLFYAHPRTVSPGDPVTLAPAILGSAPLTYRWAKDDVPIPGATQATLDIPNVKASDAGVYSLTVSNDLGAAKANVTTLTVTALPSVTLVPAYATPAEGSSFALQAQADGGTIQWWRDGVLLENASAQYSVSAATPEHAGRYRVGVSNGAGTTWSNEVVVEVLPSSPPVVDLADLTLPNWGGNTNLTATVQGVGPFSYQWYRNGEALSGATARTLSLRNIGIAELGAYYVAVTNSVGTTLSRTVDVEPLAEDTVAAHHWRQTHVLEGVVYFLYADSPRIERYDLAARDWLPTWTLPFTPVAFAFATDAIYVASETEVWRYNRNFGGAIRWMTSPERLMSVGVLGDYLVTVSSSDNFTIRYHSYQRANAWLAGSTQSSSGINSGLSYDALSRRIYGRRASSLSWFTHEYLQLNENGSFALVYPSGGTDYSSSGRTWILSAGTYFAEASGHVWSINDGTVKGNFGRMTDDAIDDGQNGFLALRHGRISRHDERFREIGSFDLATRARRLARHGTVVFGFRQPATSNERAGVSAIDLVQLQPPAGSASLNAETVAGLWSPQLEYDGADAVYIYSRLHRAVLRWSLRESRFDQTISLPASPDMIALSPRNERVYFALNRTQLWQHDLRRPSATATPFAGAKDRILNIVDTGGRLFASTLRYPSGVGTRNYLFSATGEQLGAPCSSERSDHYSWSEGSQRIYFVSNYTTPSNLKFAPVATRGLSTEQLAPYHTNAIDFSGPVRAAESGERIVLGSGRIFETGGLTLAGHVLKRLTDAVWGTDALYTVRPSAGGTKVEAWNTDGSVARASAVVAGQPLRVWQLRGDRLLVATLSAVGRTEFHFFNSHTLERLDPIDPQQPPEIVSLSGDAQIQAGGVFALAVSTRGGALPIYQWQVRLAGSTEWVDLENDGVFAGTRTGRLEAKSLPSQFSGARFRVVVSNAGGAVTSSTRSVTSHGIANTVSLAASDGALALVHADASLSTIGVNTSGRLGLDEFAERKSLTRTATDAAKVVIGARHLAWQGRDGRWWATGANTPWLPGPAIPEMPRAIGDDIAEVALGDWHALFLRRDGSLWGAGDAWSGQLLPPNVGDVPMRRMATGVTAIATAHSVSLWLTADGVLWGAGLNYASQLGDAPLNAAGARQISTNVRSMTATAERTFFIKNDHTLWWVGRLNDATSSSVPVQLAGDVRTVHASETHVVFERRDGTIWSLGRNDNGQLGDGTTSTRWQPAPIAMAGLRNVVVGTNYTAALDADGSVWVCGRISTNVDFGAMWTRLAAGLAMPPARQIVGDVSAIAASHGVALSWAPIAGATGYEVWRSAAADLAAATLLQATRGTFSLDDSASAGTSFHYWVRPLLANGAGEFSSVASGQRGEFEAPRITAHPQNQEQTGDYYAVLNFAAAGDPVPTSHWEMRAPGTETWTTVPDQWPIEGARTPRLRLLVYESTSGTQYRGVATNDYGVVRSDPATVIWRPYPFLIFSHPKGGSVVEGKSFSLTVTISGATSSTRTYEWRKDGVVLPGRTHWTLTLDAVTAADAGSYTVTITAAEGTLVSQPAVVTVVPEPPKPAVYALAAGEKHSAFLIPGAYNGGMGDNGFLQTGTLVNTQPVRTAQLHTRAREFTAIAAGANHTLLLTSTGSVYAIGDNSSNQAFGSQNLTVVRATNVAAIAAGAAHSVLLCTDGTIHGIGLNASGQLGGGTFNNRSTLTSFAADAMDVAAGAHHSLFIKSDHTLWGVGANTDGQLAQAAQTNLATPVQIAENVMQADGGANYTVFLKRDGSLWGVGRNSRGQLGQSVALEALSTTPVLLAEDVRFVAAGAEHVLFIKRDDTLWALGRNDRGQLGIGDQVDRTSPVLVAAYAARATAGQAHSLWVDADGSLWACGDNVHGQLGAGSAAAIFVTPTRVWRAIGAAPGRPTEVNATESTATGGVRITWIGAPGTMHYEVWRSPTPDATMAFRVVSDWRTPIWFDREAAPREANYYWIVAANQAGRSAFSVRDHGAHGLPSSVPQFSFISNNATATLGSSLDLSVSLTNVGSPLMVQWRRNGLPFGPATASQSITINPVTFEHAGEWDAVVTNQYGSVISRVVEISVRVLDHTLSVPAVASRAFSPLPFAVGPALSSAGLPIIYTVVSGPAQISGNRLTATGVGAVEVRAEQPGNEAVPSATPVTLRFAILPTEVPVQLRGLVRAWDGTPQTVTAQSTPALPVIITYDGSATPPTEIGTYLVRADVAAVGYLGTQFAYLTITKAPQTIAFSAPVYLEADGRPHLLNATATSALPVQLTLASGQGNVQGMQLSTTTPGALVIRAAQAGDEYFDPAPDVLRSIVFLQPYRFATWQRLRFTNEQLDDHAIGGALSDPDRDGVSNLLEFALGRDPLAPETAPILDVWRDGDGWFATYQRAAQRPELIYRIESSVDLIHWSDAEIEHTPVTTDAGAETWVALHRAAGLPGVFFRLRVERFAESTP